MILSLQYASAQRQVTGSVKDANTNQPLIGASILLQGLKTGTSTNAEGKFSLSASEKLSLLLLVMSAMNQKLSLLMGKTKLMCF